MSNADKIVAIAKGEVGTHEKKSGGHWVNDSKYNRWYGKIPGYDQSGYGYPWCAVFVAWCADQAGVASLYPKTAGCETAVAWFKRQGRFSEYPAVGAQVFYGKGGGAHTGLVYDYDATYVYTVEGNTNTNGSAEGDGVYQRRRVRRDSYVYGYGYPKFTEGIRSADPKYAAQKPADKPASPAPAKPASDSIKGIDVSNYQTSTYAITGVDFVIVKATEGTSYVNPKHDAQVKRARDNGRVVGHYHFVRDGDMKAQADYFLAHAKATKGDILALDWEDPKVSCAEKDAFLKYLKGKAADHKVMLYCNTDYWLHRDTTSYCADGLWIARYGAGAGKPGIEHEWVIHQYTSDPIDTNVAKFASRADMAKWAGQTATKPPAKTPSKPKPAKKPVVDLSNVVAAARKDPGAAQGHTTHAADVKIVEAALKAEGLLSSKYASDGSFGTTTIAAYKAWQKRCHYTGSDADGIPGSASLKKLGAKHGFTVKA